MSLKLRISILSLSTLFLCCDTKVIRPERHKDIPQEAIWYGGVDGGSWIKLDSTDSPKIFKVIVYHESGSIWKEDKFKVDRQCFEMNYSLNELKQLMTSYDGEKISLKTIKNSTNCSLIPSIGWERDVFLFKNDYTEQRIEIEYLMDKELEFKYSVKYDNKTCASYAGKAINKYFDHDPEMDEDEEGISYPVYQYVYEKDSCTLNIRVDRMDKDKVQIRVSNCAKNCEINSVGILRLNK